MIRLGLDLDGVIFDFNDHFISLAREMFPTNTCPDASDMFPTEWNYMLNYVSKQQNRALWNHIVLSRTWWRLCPPYSYSDEFIVTAQGQADKLYFITSRVGIKVQQQTLHALNSVAEGLTIHGGVIPVDQPEHKIPIINALRLTHFVDDKPETILDAWAKCLNTKIAMWDQPWNRTVALPVGVARLHNVEEFSVWLNK